MSSSSEAAGPPGAGLGAWVRWGWPRAVGVAAVVVLAGVVFEAAHKDLSRVHTVIGVLVGVGFVVAVARRPAASASVLIALLAFDKPVLAALYRVGVPSEVVRPLGFWKEGIVAGLALAAIGEYRRRRRAGGPGLDILDKLALGYVALATLYFLVPQVALGAGVHLSFYQRELGWRNDVLYVAILVIFRHLRLGPERAARIARSVVVVGTIAALVGAFEFFFTNAWNSFSVNVLGVQAYANQVLGQQVGTGFSLTTVEAYGTLGGHIFVRVGSVLYNFQAIGFLLAIAIGICLELILRGEARRWMYWAFPLMGIVVFLNQTRSAIVATVAVILIALRPRKVPIPANRTRLGLILLLLVFGGLGLALATNTFGRLTGAANSNAGHLKGLVNGIKALFSYPFGRGLATSAGAGQAAGGGGATALVTENQYLQIGDELGLLGLGLYVSVLLSGLRRLSTRRYPGAARMFVVGGTASVVSGTLIGVVFLQPFIFLQVSWVFFALLGLAVSVAESSVGSPVAGLPGGAGPADWAGVVGGPGGVVGGLGGAVGAPLGGPGRWELSTPRANLI